MDLPLVARADPAAVVAHRPGGPVTVARFLADVARVAAAFPGTGPVLNICQDRYRFMVGLGAALVSNRVSLLPASQAPETVRRLREAHPGLFALGDGPEAAVDLPRLAYPESEQLHDPASAMPRIPADRVAAILFTSGSTGDPVPQSKTWGALWRSGQAESERLGLAGHAIVATVPAQHSYGLESTVLQCLVGNCAAWAGRPFYPADIAAALAGVPGPRLLVTTPIHLRTLLDAGVALPPIDLLLSATAPLSRELAQRAEAATGAPLHEIYGCTEAGQLASRRTTVGDAWQLLPGVGLDQDEDGATWACGGHVAGRILLGDRIELRADGDFLLHGRNADLINIAGKRTSLAYLNHQLAAIPGVLDGVFHLPDGDDTDGVVRLAAAVVAPGLTPAEILAALRQRLDPVFLPRPLLWVDRLPRNATGKLTRDSLQALFANPRGKP